MFVAEWNRVVERYKRVKAFYIEGEERDPELKTNLQPLNELRNALDHICRLIHLEIQGKEQQAEQINNEFHVLNDHLRNAFFDVCDYLSVAYRNKIIDCIEGYSEEEIKSLLPRYYSEYRQKIENFTNDISSFRANNNPDEAETVENRYYEEVQELKNIYLDIFSVFYRKTSSHKELYNSGNVVCEYSRGEEAVRLTFPPNTSDAEIVRIIKDVLDAKSQ